MFVSSTDFLVDIYQVYLFIKLWIYIIGVRDVSKGSFRLYQGNDGRDVSNGGFRLYQGNDGNR